MQLLKNIYQAGGDLNGITFDVQWALWNDGNSYIIRTENSLIMIDCGCGDNPGLAKKTVISHGYIHCNGLSYFRAGNSAFF